MKWLLLSAAIAVTLGACTTNPNKIGATYVSPLKYANYDCQQLIAEQSNIERRVAALHAMLKKENSGDKWATGVGIVLFWPALFFLAGNNDVQEAEYAQLKGDYDAIQSALVQKKCSMPASATVGSPSNSTEQAASVAVAQPVSQLRAVNEKEKTDCEFIQSITKGAGGTGDVSTHLEKAMDRALNEAANSGANSYFVVDASTTASGATVILEALKCRLTSDETVKSAVTQVKLPAGKVIEQQAPPAKEIIEHETSPAEEVIAQDVPPPGLSEPELGDEYERMKSRKNPSRAYLDDPLDVPPLKDSPLRRGETVYIIRHG